MSVLKAIQRFIVEKAIVHAKTISTAGVLLIPLVSSALVAPKPVQSLNDLSVKVFCQAVNVIYTVTLVLSIIFVLVAAFNYVTAQGDPEKVKTANKTILYAAIGIAVAVVARGVPLVVGTAFGVSASNLDACPGGGGGGGGGGSPLE